MWTNGQIFVTICRILLSLRRLFSYGVYSHGSTFDTLVSLDSLHCLGLHSTVAGWNSELVYVQFSLIPLPISIPVGVRSKEYSFRLRIRSRSGLDFDSGLQLGTAKSDWKSYLKFLFGMPVADTIHVIVPKN